MFVPNAEWRCTEDLKVILITKDGRLTRTLALTFFQRFGELKECKILQQDKIACGMFTTEEDAEEALKQKYINLGGLHCDVTTFKSGNRKIYIAPLTLSESAMRMHFESNYGPILRFEYLPGYSAAFILFLKVDSSIACRNKNHSINGVTIYARPGCLPGTTFQPNRSTMYRVSPRLTKYVGSNLALDCLRNNESSITSSSDHSLSSSILDPAFKETFNGSSPFHQSFLRFSVDISPVFRHLLEELKDLSVDEIDGTKKREKRVVDMEDPFSDCISTDMELTKGKTKRRGSQITAVFTRAGTETHEALNKEEQNIMKREMEKRSNEENGAPFAVDDKWLRWEQIRIELNLPIINPCAHYSKDEEGFPIHHNGKYVHSILKDGRFRFKEDHHVSFNAQRNTVKLFKRAAEEYAFFGPRNPSKTENRLVESDENYIGGWEDVFEMKSSTLKVVFPYNLIWPISFPAQPRHFPLMDHCSYEDNLSLETNHAVRYMNHLEVRWKNTKQHTFLSIFAPFLRAHCTVCRIKLDGSRKQFEHIFSRPHLVNLNRNKVKYSPTDFTFWNNVLLHNFDIGGRNRASR